MEWLFGCAFGFLVGVLTHHTIKNWNTDTDPLLPIDVLERKENEDGHNGSS